MHAAGLKVVDRGGIEPPTFALRTRHYTTKSPARLFCQDLLVFYSFMIVPDTAGRQLNYMNGI